MVTNGMSHYARSGENINGGMLVGVTPEDFGTDHPLAGVAWQRQLEAAAYALTGGYDAPCQRVEDFLAGRPSEAAGRVKPTYRPGVVYTDLHRCLPPFVSETLALALPLRPLPLRRRPSSTSCSPASTLRRRLPSSRPSARSCRAWA